MTKEKKVKKRKKPSRIILRFRKGDHSHNVMVAVQAWLRANGGYALVMGGIGIMRESSMKFQVCVGILGRAPVKKES